MIGWVVLAIIAIDIFGFFAWFFSGQLPADEFFVGTLTAHFLNGWMF